MNNKIFEGLLPANQEAETMSKKERCEVFVVKENIGGLKYIVYTNRHSIPEGAKVLSIYSKGIKVDSMPEEKPVVIPQRPPQVEAMKYVEPEQLKQEPAKVDNCWSSYDEVKVVVAAEVTKEEPEKVEETKVEKTEPEK